MISLSLCEIDERQGFFIKREVKKALDNNSHHETKKNFLHEI